MSIYKTLAVYRYSGGARINTQTHKADVPPHKKARSSCTRGERRIGELFRLWSLSRVEKMLAIKPPLAGDESFFRYNLSLLASQRGVWYFTPERTLIRPGTSENLRLGLLLNVNALPRLRTLPSNSRLRIFGRFCEWRILPLQRVSRAKCFVAANYPQSPRVLFRNPTGDFVERSKISFWLVGERVCSASKLAALALRVFFAQKALKVHVD
jgi:hypothetical protein